MALTYAIADDKGEVVEQHDVPLGFVYGSDTELIGSMDKAVGGRRAGDEVEVKVPAEQGFGPHDPSLTFTDDIENVPPQFRQIGAEVQMQNSAGEVKSFYVTSIENGKLTYAVQELTVEKCAHSTVFSPDNRWLLVPATCPNKVFLNRFDPESGKLIGRSLYGALSGLQHRRPSLRRKAPGHNAHCQLTPCASHDCPPLAKKMKGFVQSRCQILQALFFKKMATERPSPLAADAARQCILFKTCTISSHAHGAATSTATAIRRPAAAGTRRMAACRCGRAA